MASGQELCFDEFWNRKQQVACGRDVPERFCFCVVQSWVDSGSGAFDFTEVASYYVSKAEYSAWYDDQTVFGEAWKAANRIKDMLPERHPAAS